jgi:hypothetical protein
VTESTQPDFTTPLKVVVSFNYTIDDLREGLALPPQDRRKKRPAILTWGSWIVFVFFATIFFLLLNRNRGAFPPPAGPLPPVMTEPPPRWIDLRLLVVPSATAALCVASLILGLFVTGRLARSKSLHVRRNSGYAFVVSCILCGLLFWMGSWLLGTDLFQSNLDPEHASIMLIVWTPWLALLAALIIFGVVVNRGALQRQWNKKKSYQRRRTVELNDQGLRNSDEMGENFYRWPYFQRAWETPNELVLVDEADLRHILPKRAFEEVGGLDTARSLIGSHIADAKFLTQPVGFPVRPIAVPPPIPHQ